MTCNITLDHRSVNSTGNHLVEVSVSGVDPIVCPNATITPDRVQASFTPAGEVRSFTVVGPVAGRDVRDRASWDFAGSDAVPDGVRLLLASVRSLAGVDGRTPWGLIDGTRSLYERNS